MVILKENFNSFKSSIGLSPYEGIEQDAKINIEQAIFVPNDPPGVYPIYNMAHYRGLLLSVHFIADTWSSLEGSAVMVAPGIALTAIHVIEDHIPKIMESKFYIACVGYTPSGARGWRVKHFIKVNNTDLMILSLDYASHAPEDNLFVHARMTARLPRIGETVMIAGFKASDERVPFTDGQTFAVKDGCVKYGTNLRIGVGKVTEHYLGGRGSWQPGPRIEVACSTSGGLSGGPAFDQNGRLVGILSSSISVDPPDELGPSYISLLVPALAITINPAFLSRFCSDADSVRLLDLRPEICDIEEREFINTTTSPTTGDIRVEINNW